VRVDTHKKNTSMQRIMAHCGFELRGIVYVDDEIDNERLAYQKLL
ncbi:GNAT family N-acetyltransferase, partial [Escherichia coli]|nr:GNAT family N-acetyltransferase [Escherichia coli]